MSSWGRPLLVPLLPGPPLQVRPHCCSTGDSSAETTDVLQHLHPSLSQLCLSVGVFSMRLHQHELVAKAHHKVAAALLSPFVANTA